MAFLNNQNTTYRMDVVVYILVLQKKKKKITTQKGIEFEIIVVVSLYIVQQ